MTEKTDKKPEDKKDSNSKDFIRAYIAEDVAAGKNGGKLKVINVLDLVWEALQL